jgi:DNA (cytosine-5)-methyltransferase 1
MTCHVVSARYQSTPEELIDLNSKLSRLREGKPLRVVDLFSGCGGMSLGLHRAGYSLLGGVEINPKAIHTHASNFFNQLGEESFELHSTPRDIRTFTPDLFMREILHKEHSNNLVDLIVGGPPCQAFARVGRAKLRHVRQDPEAYLKDERASLYLQYLAYVEYFRPLAVIMENVPDIMNYGGRNVAEEIACTLDELGYRCHYTILNTANYGVPQMRQRFYLIALLDALNINPDPYFPEPTHFIEVSPGYEHARSTALSMIPRIEVRQKKLFDNPATHYIAPPSVSKHLPPAITTQEALSDLPPIFYHLELQTGRGRVRNFDTMVRYSGENEPSAYALDMRTWPNFQSRGGIWDHVIRLLPRDYPIFARMEQGAEYPRAYKFAEQIFHEKLSEQEAATGRVIAKDSAEYQALWKATVPPYDPNKFPNKWWKLIPDQPSRTLTAHMGKDTYSHIHYSDDQARVISVREAARLQSFPDGFQFTGPMNAAYTQIGNAVSPLQAYRFGIHMQAILKKAADQRYEINEAYLHTSAPLEENMNGTRQQEEVVGSA